jgi:succinate dehydrogenase/fumarate reductase flavoprotein subunit
LNEIEYIKKVELPKIYITTKNIKFNLELVEALQLKNIILNLEVIAKAALFRTESRGTHYRSDFPMEDNDNLRANIIVRQVRGKDGIIELFKRPSVILQNPFRLHRRI